MSLCSSKLCPLTAPHAGKAYTSTSRGLPSLVREIGSKTRKTQNDNNFLDTFYTVHWDYVNNPLPPPIKECVNKACSVKARHEDKIYSREPREVKDLPEVIQRIGAKPKGPMAELPSWLDEDPNAPPRPISLENEFSDDEGAVLADFWAVHGRQRFSSIHKRPTTKLPSWVDEDPDAPPRPLSPLDEFSDDEGALLNKAQRFSSIHKRPKITLPSWVDEDPNEPPRPLSPLDEFSDDEGTLLNKAQHEGSMRGRQQKHKGFGQFEISR